MHLGYSRSICRHTGVAAFIIYTLLTIISYWPKYLSLSNCLAVQHYTKIYPILCITHEYKHFPLTREDNSLTWLRISIKECDKYFCWAALGLNSSSVDLQENLYEKKTQFNLYKHFVLFCFTHIRIQL